MRGVESLIVKSQLGTLGQAKKFYVNLTNVHSLDGMRFDLFSLRQVQNHKIVQVSNEEIVSV